MLPFLPGYTRPGLRTSSLTPPTSSLAPLPLLLRPGEELVQKDRRAVDARAADVHCDVPGQRWSRWFQCGQEFQDSHERKVRLLRTFKTFIMVGMTKKEVDHDKQDNYDGQDFEWSPICQMSVCLLAPKPDPGTAWTVELCSMSVSPKMQNQENSF